MTAKELAPDIAIPEEVADNVSVSYTHLTLPTIA